MPLKERLDFVTFDVFTQTPFKGNPLAIVKVPVGFSISKSQKQSIAREFNFSETVFLHQGEHAASGERKIDIFTTTEELPFAGHPTIGTICSIATNAGPDAVEKLTLLTKAGPIRSKYDHGSSSAMASIPHNVHIHHDYLVRSRVEDLFPSGENKPDDDLLDLWPFDSSGVSLTFPVVSVVKGMTFILIGFPHGGGQLQKLQVGRQLTYAKSLSLDEEWLPSFIAPYFYEILSEQEDKTLSIRARMIGRSLGRNTLLHRQSPLVLVKREKNKAEYTASRMFIEIALIYLLSVSNITNLRKRQTHRLAKILQQGVRPVRLQPTLLYNEEKLARLTGLTSNKAWRLGEIAT